MTSYNNHGREKIPKTGKQNQQSKWQHQQQQQTQYQKLTPPQMFSLNVPKMFEITAKASMVESLHSKVTGNFCILQLCQNLLHVHGYVSKSI